MILLILYKIRHLWIRVFFPNDLSIACRICNQKNRLKKAIFLAYVRNFLYLCGLIDD